MLTAYLPSGELFTIRRRLSQKEIYDLRESAPFLCPACRQKMLLKAGPSKFPHFAHFKDRSCTFESEPETLYHLEGKLALYHWLRDQGIEAVLEAGIPEINQRADILITSEGKRIAIEFQCSAIPQEVWAKRTRSYHQAGIRVLWILGKEKLKSQYSGTLHDVSLGSFEWLFPFGSSAMPTFIAFCPKNSVFFKSTSILPFSPRSTLVEFKISGLRTTSFTSLIKEHLFVTSSQIRRWLYKKEKWKQFSHRYATVQDPFFRELYLRKLPPASIPAEAGVPVPYMHLIETSPLRWQSYLFLDLFYDRPAGTVIQRHKIKNVFTKRLMKGDIILRHNGDLPEATNPYIPLFSYLTFLVQSGCLNSQKNGEFILRKDFIACMPEGEEEKTREKMVKYLESFYSNEIINQELIVKGTAFFEDGSLGL
ncbi:competence protein CoiA [Peribacillus kribbensis]|uniref:competence protein CoiA n=1 Tax=Peribacillus kribbensis TaxID=356658 RepID=UPI0003F5C0B6|nr:competence protein CoiA family protein [Peribacillus kribbensis]